ncbi:MAG: tandem-95 repeat protein, partial [Candidatus Marinimicrobia bacterium]|nr:tandem-95 repeat protein [Candidatus Neomarinimicrobiota bacterium]
MKLFKLFVLMNIINFAFCYITASFEAEPTSGTAPLEVFFTDYSYSDLEITSWMWDFENDGIIDSEEQNPTWMYIPGTYSVKLIVNNGIEVDTIILQNMISVSEQTGEGTDITESSVYGQWTIDGSPYRIHNSISVIGDRSLYIQQGVLVIFEGDYTLDVFGSIWAEKVAFYRVQDTAPLDWGGITIHENAYNDNQIDNCSIFYTSPGITIKNPGTGRRATTTISNNRVRSGENRQGNFGIEIDGDTNADIQSNSFIGFWDGAVITNTGSSRATSTITNNRFRSGENRSRSGAGLIVDGNIEFYENDLIGFSTGASITFSDSTGYSRATTTMNNNRVRSGENRVGANGIEIYGNISCGIENNDIEGFSIGVDIANSTRQRASSTMTNNRVRSGENRTGVLGVKVTGSVDVTIDDNDVTGYSDGISMANSRTGRASGTMSNNRVRSGENRFSNGKGILLADGVVGYVHDNVISDFDSALVFFGTISSPIHDNLIFVTPPSDADIDNANIGSIAIYVDNSTDTLDVNNNTTYGFNLGFVSPNAQVNFQYNMIWNLDPSTIPIVCDNITASYNNIALPWGDIFPGYNNLNIDPLFMSPQDGNFNFQPGSEFAGNGNYNNWGMGSNPWDESALNIFFDADKMFGYAPLSVSFSSIALEPVQLPGPRQIYYEWDFGDGETSTEANPTHIFYYEGDYTVELSAEYVTDSTSVTATFKREDYIKVVSESSEPEFSEIPSSYNFGYVPLQNESVHTFSFKNTGGQTLTISEVSFNDGNNNFSFLSELPITVFAGDFGYFDVKFQPSEETQYTDKLELTYNNGAIYDLDLIGEGLDAILYEGFEQGDFGLLTSYFVGDFGETTSNWYSYSPGANQSEFCVVHGNDASDFGVDDWLVTPEINLLGFINPTMSWNNGEGFAGGNSTREIRVSTDSGDPQSGTFTLLHNVSTSSGAGWNNESVDLSAFVGQTIYLAFHYEGNAGAGGYWGLDDLIVDGEFVSNTPPIAYDVSVETDEDISVSITLSGSDSDGDELVFMVESSPSHGTLMGEIDLTYVPNGNYNGTDSFVYLANDGEYYSEPATVTITINPVNDPPIAVDDSFTMDQNTTLSANVMENDYDIENHDLVAVLVDDSSIHGNITFNSDGLFVYSPNQNFAGVDVFTYKVQEQVQTTCADGEIIDCVDDTECHNENWIGDGYGDCADEVYGANLCCYNLDGGDCTAEECSEARCEEVSEEGLKVEDLVKPLHKIVNKSGEMKSKLVYSTTNIREESEIATVTITVNSTTVTFDKNFATGWNWFSINVEADDMSLNTVLESIGVNGVTIKNLTGFATYYADFGWYGLDLIDVTSMYMIQMTESSDLVFAGTAVDYENTPIALSTGWNWIGYLPQNANLLDPALYSIGANGITIKSQTEFATYYADFGWYGMAVLVSGDGYMLQMSSSAELVYGVPEEGLVRNDEASIDFHWSVNPHQFEHNMTITADVEIDGIQI